MEYPSNNHEKNTRMTTISYLVSGDNYFCDFLNFEKCFKACADFYRFFVGIACRTYYKFQERHGHKLESVTFPYVEYLQYLTKK